MSPKLLSALFLSLAFLFGFASSHADEGTKAPNICPANEENSGTVEWSGYATIGGIHQWLTISGDSCEKPVVLFIHGGPGNTLSPFAHKLYGEWRSEFVLVQWDQRGAGKTFEANQEPGELTVEKISQTELNIDLMVKDGLEVTDFLLRTLGKDKIIITGTSWGSVLAVKMIDQKPENYLFYVGLSQLVNTQRNLLSSYNSVLERARESEDAEAVEQLVGMGPPPWQNPRNFGGLRRIVKRYEGAVTDQELEWQPAKEYSDQAALEAYYSGEDFSFIKFVGFNGDGMASDITLDEDHLSFEMPIYLIQGEEDLLTQASITKSYFDKIDAPRKKLIRVEKAGHDTNYPMLESHLQTLREGVAALPTDDSPD